jgi:hypothetical protein
MTGLKDSVDDRCRPLVLVALSANQKFNNLLKGPIRMPI